MFSGSDWEAEAHSGPKSCEFPELSQKGPFHLPHVGLLTHCLNLCNNVTTQDFILVLKNQLMFRSLKDWSKTTWQGAVEKATFSTLKDKHRWCKSHHLVVCAI